jgi:hypothetical protein
MKEKVTILRCSLCEKLVGLEREQKVSLKTYFTKREAGETLTKIKWGAFQYSTGIWFNKRNLLDDFAGEICEDCFHVVSEKVAELEKVVKAKKGSNRNTIMMLDTRGNGAPEKLLPENTEPLRLPQNGE